MGYSEEDVREGVWAVTVGSDSSGVGGVVISVDEEAGTLASAIGGVAMSASSARALAALLLKHADRAEGKS